MTQARFWIFATPQAVESANAALAAHDAEWADTIAVGLPEQTDLSAPPPEPQLYFCDWNTSSNVLTQVRSLLDNQAGVRIFEGVPMGGDESQASDDDTIDPSPGQLVTQRAATAIAARQLEVNLSPPA
jgi:hypothetical protein